MVKAGSEEILVDHLLTGKAVLRDVRIIRDRAIRQMIKRQEFLSVWIYGNGIRISGEQPVTGIQRWNGGKRGDALGLTDTLIVGKEKCPLSNDWPTDRSAKLVAFERRNFRTVEEIPGIQRAVAEKFVTATVKITGARACNGVNNAARSLAVFRRVIAGEDREFLNGVNSQASTQYAAGR